MGSIPIASTTPHQGAPGSGGIRCGPLSTIAVQPGTMELMLRVAGLPRVDPDVVLARLAAAELTYGEVGATMHETLPDGYHHVRAAIDLGSGPRVWEMARRALVGWVPQRGAGATVRPLDAPQPGREVMVTLAVGPVAVLAPCRIVATFDEPDLFGYAYGTLTGHPERGEEVFLARRTRDDVRFEVTAFSRPTGVAAMAKPISRLVQDRMTRRYLRAVAAYVSAPSSCC